MDKDRFSALMAIMTPDIISKIMERFEMDEDKAMAAFHRSELYKTLEKENTKVWQYSALMLAELFNEERAGRLSLPEV